MRSRAERDAARETEDADTRAPAYDVRRALPADAEAIAAIKQLAEIEGIIPALESAHAIVAVGRLAPRLSRRQSIIVNLSGRGDKDMMTVGDYLGAKL